MASIHPEVSTRHEGAPLRQEEHSWGLEILRRPEPPEECTSHPDLLQVGIRGQKRVCHGRSYVPWGQSVHPDSILAPLLCHRAAKLLDCGFAAVVCGACQSLGEKVSAVVGTLKLSEANEGLVECRCAQDLRGWQCHQT